ncbi:hypothetical protein Cni_G13918 [Canna indica]|uniref:Uncharacterized protein n=1 Tax=Canna indica TaxID=4628 RepID=A0AAQ3QD50_9LILI|nr:hypothetical protein Cni_G13918 [Canna indica]
MPESMSSPPPNFQRPNGSNIFSLPAMTTSVASRASGSSSAGYFTKLSKPSIILAKKVIAEFIGTYILIFSAAATPIVNQKYNDAATLIGAATSAGLAVTIIVISIGHISGAHLNPSVTIAFAAIHHFPWPHVPAYILAQLLGSIAASFTLSGVFHPFHSGGVTVPTISTSQAFFLEFVITSVLMFVIVAVATDTRAPRELAGVAIGATILMNILVAGSSTGGSMNPVRTLGPAIATSNYKEIWLYMVAPVIGAVFGAYAYQVVKLHVEDMEVILAPPMMEIMNA